MQSGQGTSFQAEYADPPVDVELTSPQSKDIRPTAFDPKHFTVDQGQWLVQGNELVQTDGRAHWPCLMFAAGDDQWTDYDVTVDLMRIHGNQVVNLVVRGTDKDNQLSLANGGYSGTRSYIQAVERGQIKDAPSVPFKLENRKWYSARVRVRGSEIAGSLVDGTKEVAKVKSINGLHPKGRVGLRTWYSSCRFKNIKVTSLDGKTLWEGPPAIDSPRPVGTETQANPSREGWVTLFNGKDLTGWTAFRKNSVIEPEEIFFVDRNELVSYPGTLGTLTTESAYSNFVFSLDYHIRPREEAGLVFQTAPPDGYEIKSFECQIIGEQPNSGSGCGDILAGPGVMTDAEAKRAVKNQLYHRSRRAELSVDGWNTYEVRCEGQKFTVTLNGVVVNQVESVWSGPWRVGLNAEERGSARFRNVTITGPGGTDPTVTRKSVVRNTTVPAQFQAILSAFAPEIGLSTRAVGQGGLALLKEHRGRPNCLRTHPVDPKIPCTLSAEIAVPAGKKSRLVLEVAHEPNGDWQLVVKANGATLHNSTIGPNATKGGWAVIVVDLSKFAGQTVNLELLNQANNWRFEAGYWARVAVESAAEVDGETLDRPDRTQPGEPPVPPAATSVSVETPKATTSRRSTATPAGSNLSKSSFTGMPFVRIEAGGFLCGSPDEDNRAGAEEKPQHPVRITRPFYLGEHEVTQEEYQRVDGTTPSALKDHPDHPVERVRWLDTNLFCNMLSEKEGLAVFYKIEGEAVSVSDWTRGSYRLPTSAEWEYACRAGTTTPFFSDPEGRTMTDYAWFDKNGRGATHPVGQLEPNPWGLYDMTGNVREWCWDYFDPDYYKKGVATDPRGPDSGARRVIRGGGFTSWLRAARSTTLFAESPVFLNRTVGFRVARSAGSEKGSGTDLSR